MGKSESGSFEFKIDVNGNSEIRNELFSRLADRNWPILMLKPNELTLEEVFMKLIDGTVDTEQLESFSAEVEKKANPEVDKTSKAALDAVNDILGEQIAQFDNPDDIKTEKEEN